MTTASQRVARFTSTLQYDALPAEVTEKSKVTLLHNLGVALAAGSLGDRAVGYAAAVQPYDGGQAARLLTSGQPVSAFTAAYVNAALVHARAQDDVYFPGLTHVGATIIPPLLAVGETLDSSGQELLTALVAGYEATAVLSRGFAQRTTPRGFRATGLYGTLGAAAAVARLLRLDEAQTASALGIAACMAAGTNQTWVAGTDEWQFQVGIAATSGMTAALQASAGGAGATDALEGRAGFYASFMGDCEGVADIGADLGTTWHIADVTYKPFPVCAILQAPVSELMSLLKNNGVTADDVTGIHLVLSPGEKAYPGTDSTGPFGGPGAALMSAQFCLAIGAVEGRVTAADLYRDGDPRLRDVVQRVTLADDDQLSARSFRLRVDLTDGGVLHHAFTATNATFNWNREQVIAQLTSMSDELPLDPSALGQLTAAALAAEGHSVRELVSACVVST